jgi:hypothetical protein
MLPSALPLGAEYHAVAKSAPYGSRSGGAKRPNARRPEVELRRSISICFQAPRSTGCPTICRCVWAHGRIWCNRRTPLSRRLWRTEDGFLFLKGQTMHAMLKVAAAVFIMTALRGDN